MDIAQSFAQLAQMQVAHQMRFYRDNAKLDAHLMQRFPDLIPADEGDDSGPQRARSGGERDDQGESVESPAADSGKADQESGADPPIV